jgi:hypothetical protein
VLASEYLYRRAVQTITPAGLKSFPQYITPLCEGSLDEELITIFYEYSLRKVDMIHQKVIMIITTDHKGELDANPKEVDF